MVSIRGIFSRNVDPPHTPRSYKKVGKGSDKIVWVRADTDVHKKAFYTPNKAFLMSREKALIAEYQTVENINNAIDEKGVDKTFLACSWKRRDKGKRIKKKTTIKVDYSKANLEEAINDPSVSFPKRVSFLRNAICGLLNLHKAGYVHKDLKPENFLVFDTENEGEEIVKLSDFGRCTPIDDEKKSVYEGNTRFVSPEGGTSPKSEVFSLALILIRGLEGALDEPVLEVPKNERDCKAHSCRKGLDKYVLEHKAFICCENKGTSIGRIKNFFRRNKMNKESPEKKAERCAAQEAVLNAYIDKMVDKLTEKGLVPLSDSIKLSHLLKSMVQANPEERPNLDSVLEEYNNIFSPESE